MSNSITLCFNNLVAENYVNNFSEITPIDIDENFSIESAEIFIKSILIFNDIQLNPEFIEALNSDDEIALEGGLHFSSSTHHIFPSCCCDFHEWTEVALDIKKKISPWMGHDPSPYIEFSNDTFTIWSDERSKNNDPFCIQYEFSYFDSYISDIERNIEVSIPIIINWISKHSDLDLKNLEKALLKYMRGMVLIGK